MQRVLINCGGSQANGDYSWVDTTVQKKFIKAKQYMPETSYIMQVGQFLNIDTHEWLSIGYTSNHEQVNKLKQCITHHGLDFFKQNQVVCFFLVSSVTILHLNDQIIYAHPNDGEHFYNCNHWTEMMKDNRDEHLTPEFIKFQRQYLPFHHELQKLQTDLNLFREIFEGTGNHFFAYCSEQTYNLDLPDKNWLFKDSCTYDAVLQEAGLFKDFANIEERAQIMVNAHLRDPWTFHYTQQGSKVVAKLIKDELHQKFTRSKS